MIQACINFPYLRSFELPIISPKISKRNTKKKILSILTSTSIKDQLEEKENRKRSKAEEIKIKNKIKNRKYAKKKRISNKKTEM